MVQHVGGSGLALSEEEAEGNAVYQSKINDVAAATRANSAPTQISQSRLEGAFPATKTLHSLVSLGLSAGLDCSDSA